MNDEQIKAAMRARVLGLYAHRITESIEHREVQGDRFEDVCHMVVESSVAGGVLHVCHTHAVMRNQLLDMPLEMKANAIAEYDSKPAGCMCVILLSEDEGLGIFWLERHALTLSKGGLA